MELDVLCLLGITSFLFQSSVVLSLNDEGIALLRFKNRIENDPFGALLNWKESSLENHPCSWYGIDCVDGHVVSLRLKDLCIAGTLAPELGHLVHIKLIILRNNSLSGSIPEELAGLKELEVLDLGFNNLSGILPNEWGNNVGVLLLDNNGQFCHVPHEIERLMMISEVQVEESDLSPVSEDPPYDIRFKSSCVAEHAKMLSYSFIRRDHRTNDPMHRRKLQVKNPNVVDLPSPPPPPPPKALRDPKAAPPPDKKVVEAPPPSPRGLETPPPSPTSSNSTPSDSPPPSSGTSKTKIIVIAASVGGFLLLALIACILILRTKKFASVGPWRTGMSGRIQRSPVNGTPILKRSELEAACEDFSNVIGSSSIGTLYKGTLSSGAEIAVLSYAIQHTKEWSNDMQTLFRKKVEKLARVSHKNFLNLLGYCNEDKPFTRMLVFEYAPSGTLFEHLYDWTMRLRIMMGIAYCLEHMHALDPYATQDDLTAYAVSLSEDYATKLSDFSIWNEVALAAQPIPNLIQITTNPSEQLKPEDNVYSFGLILLEMVTGKSPHSMNTGMLNEWALDYFRGETPLKNFVDPMLRHFDLIQLEKIGEVIKSCTLPELNGRPAMADLAAGLREITGIAPERAAPRMSMWWPEISLQSVRSQNEQS
ncbi:hypothetical protein V2J09_024180 [Rumex salicifolius]